MKLLHCSDLHIGKRVNGFSMLADQQKVLSQVAALAGQEQVDALLIAGDVYDKSIPSAEAVELFDWFLTRLAEQGTRVLLISGNHDSPERLDYASRLLRSRGVFIAGTYRGEVPVITLEDAYGPADLYLLPFFRPGVVNRYAEQHCATYQEAAQQVLLGLPAHPERRNVLVAHQFVVSGGREPERSDSEQLSLGGVDQIDAAVFDGFDYVALGHIHGPQRIGRDTVRYSGSPLKYSFSECRHQKSVCLVELREKGDVTFRLLPLEPLHDMRKIRGTLAQLTDEAVVAAADRNDYLHVTLTDEEPVLDAIGKLRRVYPNVMQLEFENRRSAPADISAAAGEEAVQACSMQELFAQFYQAQNNQPMPRPQQELLQEAVRRVEEAE